MALTLSRWLLLAGLGCAIVAVAYWPEPPQPDRWTPRRQPQPAAEIVVGDIYQTSHQLTVLEQRDSVLASFRTGPADALRGRPALRLDLVLPAGVRDTLSQTFSALVAAWQPVAPEITTLLVVLADSARPREHVYGFWHLDPDATDGHTCLSLAFVSSREMVELVRERSSEQVRDWLARAAGPCAFYGAFGRPGPGVTDWLRRHNAIFAQSPDWQVARGPADAFPEGEGTPPLYAIVPLLFSSSMGGRASLALRGCADGRMAACAALLDSTRSADVTPFGTRYGVSWTRWWYWDNTDLTRLLADMVRAIGRERFGQFWRSDAPRDEAFRAAVGQDIRDYTHDWLRGRFSRLRIGPKLPFSVLLMGLGLLGAFLSAGVYFNSRRQVG